MTTLPTLATLSGAPVQAVTDAAAAAANGHHMLVTAVAAISIGSMLVVLSHRLNLPSIVLLLLGGVLLGPVAIGIVQPDSLGDGLMVVVELGVGLILFEGGLTLEREGYRSAPAMIKRLLTVGVLITWAATTLLIRLIVELDWSQAILAAALVIVTGPTVIAPLLKRLKISPRLHSILHWEAVLIDPIGVFIAVLCYEWVAEHGGQIALVNLGIRIGIGMAVGIIGGALMLLAVQRRLVPRETVNVFALAGAVLTFGVADAVIPKAGLLAVTVSGFIFGLAGTTGMKQVRRFKAEITDLLIGTLFILLAARLEFAQFREFGWQGALVVALTMLLVRPLGILICSWRLDLSLQERTFLSWVAPRGIVAASLASLFAIGLEMRGADNPRFVETFTYSVIIATIVLQGLTAGPFAKALGVSRPEPRGWLIVGAHALGQRVAAFIRDVAKLPVTLVDTNPRTVGDATAHGVPALQGDAREAVELMDRHGLSDIGNVLALTDNEDLNIRLCEIWSELVGDDRVHRCNPVAAEPDDDHPDVYSQIVWPALARPSLIATEIAREDADVSIVPTAEDLPPDAVRLARYDGTRLHLDPAPSAPLSDADCTLVLRRKADHLARAVRPELVADVTAGSLRELFEQLVDRMVEIHPKLAREEVVTELLERERAAPTLIGHGIAVPHTYSRHLPERLCAIARLSSTLLYPDAGGSDVRLVFLVISPQGDPEGHLATLAGIARLVATPRRRARLMEAESPLAFLR